ncbi:hypothetical protein SAMN05428965_3617 [Geodermatophilus sp. DSM 45219]|nr:hypothetical protein SAMN05428965_3617 [Geodermatophilus sp. DSM 45219]
MCCLSVESAQAAGDDCGLVICPSIQPVEDALEVAYVSQNSDGQWIANNVADATQPYRFRLRTPCEVDTAAGGICRPDDDVLCPANPDQVVQLRVLERQRLVLADGRTVDGFDPLGAPAGTPVGDWLPLGRGCVDITALNPPPSPGEVFRYFQELPLPDLPTQQQPPGNALAGLPVVFYTDGPTTETFTVDIRGFTVDIVATASAFTWDTGDGTVLQTTDPGAPYPNHTVSHDYRSGTYTASLTTTWSGTFSVNGGATADVPGTTTTDGLPATFTVLQASPVLTNPFD